MFHSSPRTFYEPFFFHPTSNGFFFWWICRYGGYDGKLASHILLSQRPDPKEKQVINPDQDVEVCGYFWWMLYELLCMHHLSFSFFLDKGLSFLFLFFLTYIACGIPSLGMHLLFSFCIAPYLRCIFEREVSYMDMEFYFVDGWNFAYFLV